MFNTKILETQCSSFAAQNILWWGVKYIVVEILGQVLQQFAKSVIYSIINAANSQT